MTTNAKVARVGDKAELGQNFNSTVKRSFSGEAKEIISEILQNSQRAGAGKVSINASESNLLITIVDDGGGIGDTIESWRKLFCFTATEYKDSDVAKNQKPMGVGLLSLLAKEGVDKVIVHSGTKSVTIDTDKFWSKAGYWEKWTSLIKETGTDLRGFSISFKLRDAKVFEQFTRVWGQFRDRINPFTGYDDLLSFFINGEKTIFPNLQEIVVGRNSDKWLETEYQGNRLQYAGEQGSSYINWFGQVIESYGSKINFRFVLTVTKGTPVTPKSPTRSGLVDDDKITLLNNFLGEEAFAVMKSLEAYLPAQFAEYKAMPRGKDKPESLAPKFLTKLFFEGLGKHNATKRAELSWVSTEVTPDQWSNIDDFAYITNDIIRYKDEIDLWVDAAILVHKKPEYSVFKSEDDEGAGCQWMEMSHGAVTFINNILENAAIFHGGSKLVKSKLIAWKPGAELDYFFTERGEYALIDGNGDRDKALETAVWMPVTETVFAFESGNYDVNSIEELIVGAETLEQKLEILNDGTTGLSAGFSPGDERDYDDAQDDFDKSVDEIARMLDSNRIKREFDQYELRALCSRRLDNKSVTIKAIEFIFPAEAPEAPMTAFADKMANQVLTAAIQKTPSATAIRVTVTTGETVDFDLTY